MRHFLFILTFLVVSAFLSTGALPKKVDTADNSDNRSLILVMGATGSGKTTFINLASGSNLRVGHSLESCTNEVQISSTFELDGKQVTLIDTPGFDDTTKTDTEILQMVAAFLAATYEHGKRLTGVVYLHRITDPRLTGVSSRNFKMFRELCGEQTLKNVLVVTNMWENLQSRAVGEQREAELRDREMFFKPVLDKGAVLLRNYHTAKSAHNILRHLLDKDPVTLQIQHELVIEKKNISDAAAFIELNRQHLEDIKRHKEELNEIRKEMGDAMRNKDIEREKELMDQARRHQQEIDKLREGDDSDQDFWKFLGHVATILPLFLL